jgi:FixJ family two-component response regulator
MINHQKPCSPKRARPPGLVEDRLVQVLCDTEEILTGLGHLLTEKNFKVKCFMKPADFFKEGPPSEPTCLIVDHPLGDGSSGFDVHAEMVRRSWNLPTVILTERLCDVQSIVRAIHDGVAGFIIKPFEPTELIETVMATLERARALREENLQIMQARHAASQLNSREYEIVQMVCAGMINKEIADRLGLAEVTVKLHRGRVMRKLGAGNTAELARIAMMGGICR